MGIILFIIAIVLFVLLSLITIPYTIIKYIFKPKKIVDYFFQLAFAFDQLGNVMIAPMANDVLIKKDATKLYGNPDETISHVTGVNYINRTLTSFGYFIAHTLNAVDKNHVEKASESEQ